MSSGKIIRRRYVFYGDVQGVGFRWHARTATYAVGACGWVKNETDGSVTMELEGYLEQIETVIEKLCSDSWIRVEHMEVKELTPLHTEHGFEVRF